MTDPKAPPLQRRPSNTRPSENAAGIDYQAWIMTAIGAAFVLLHLAAALSPSGVNWGVHLLSFLSPAIMFGALGLMLLALLTGVQEFIVRFVRLAGEQVQRMSPSVWRIMIVVLTLAAILLFWMAKQKTFLLGDGRLAMRNLGDIHNVDVIPVGFKNAPLPGYLVWKLSLLLKTAGIEPAAQLAFQLFSMAMGAASLLVLLLLVKRLSQDPVERTLAYLLVIAGGGSQLFFGYVEAYTASYWALLLFIWLALAYLDGSVHLAFPAAAFGVLLVCHFGMVFLAPAMLFLLYHGLTRRGIVECIVSLAVLAGIAALALWMSGYTLELLETVFFRESGTHTVPIVASVTGWHAYALLSPWHILDLLNLYALVAPFSLVVVVVLAKVIAVKLGRVNGEWILFALVALGGIAFSFLMNFDIGMSRDWDLVSPYVLAVVLAATFFWIHGVESPVMRRRFLVMMAVITGLHTAAYVLVNAGEEPGLARFKLLPDSRLWGSSAMAYAYEDLSAYYRDRGEGAPASLFAEKCLQADSTNSRRWVNASLVFRNSGDRVREIHAYEKAIQLGTQIAWVYGNLGSEYIKADRLDEAAGLLRRALVIDPELPMAAYNLGSLLGSRQNKHDEALYYLMRAVKTDSTFPLAWLNAGTCLYEMGRFDEMKLYYERFLELAPADPAAPAIRRLVANTGTRR